MLRLAREENLSLCESVSGPPSPEEFLRVLAARGSALVLLDEPTASLDRDTEANVYSNLFETFADACIVSSVHRLDLLPRFDEVIAMEGGRIIAHGAPSIIGTGFAAGLPREAGTAS